MNFFVEGLQGSGKSTLAARICERKPDHVLVMEGDYSQVELAWCAYMDEDAYEKMLSRYPGMRREIEEKTFTEGDHRVVCYTKVKAEDRSFYEDLERYEIYNGRTSYEDFRDIVFSRLKAWDQDKMIYECSLFQNIVEDMILFRCATDEEIIGFYKEVRQVLDGKDYHIVYLKAEDVRENLGVIRKERSDDQGNELWFPMMLGFFNDSPYGRKYGLSGEDDLISHFTHRQDLELRILKEVFADRHTVLVSKKYTDQDLEAL